MKIVCLLCGVLLLVKIQAQTPAGIQFKGAHYLFSLTGDLKNFQANFFTKPGEEGVEYIVLQLKANQKIKPAPVTLRWSLPVKDIQATWTPERNFNKYLNPNWKENSFRSRAATHAPVTALYNFNDQNRLTFAASDALNALKIASGVRESDGTMDCELQLFTEPQPDIDTYELTLRLDTRNLPYWETLRAVAAWWETLPAYKPTAVPDTARLPMYSTWYSFHQKFTAAEIEMQCSLAKAIGCETVIVDDGWQTLDSNLGYAFTGDWNPDRIPDMKEHVNRVHQLGMKYMLWYSVPFVGEKSGVFNQFKGKYLYYRKRWSAYALDPRFPDVRNYLISKYADALRQWNLDGFKLDFVDSFVADDTTVQKAIDGRDYASVNDAVDRLLTDVITALRAIRPDIMIEFRQTYIGPLMRKYGNMFRAADVPNDALSNRVRTVDVRLLAGNTAVHSDMLMWHKEESPEAAALQLLNVWFSVPQISVKLDEVPATHVAMLRFWLHTWRKYRTLILDRQFLPANPTLNYPMVTVADANTQLTAVYMPQALVNIKTSLPKECLVINATHNNSIVIQLAQPAGIRTVRIQDCQGKQVSLQKEKLDKGYHQWTVPPSGLLTIY